MAPMWKSRGTHFCKAHCVVWTCHALILHRENERGRDSEKERASMKHRYRIGEIDKEKRGKRKKQTRLSQYNKSNVLMMLCICMYLIWIHTPSPLCIFKLIWVGSPASQNICACAKILFAIMSSCTAAGPPASSDPFALLWTLSP